MRQVQVRVRADDERRVLRLAEEHGASSPAATTVRLGDGAERALVLAELQNDRVGRFLEAVEDAVPEAEISFSPSGTLTLSTPLTRVDERVRTVTTRSTLELVLGALQSVGSWRGMLLYALFSGLVAAYGVIFETPWLLTAAMLIAPVGAPAMVSVVGIAVGDVRLVLRGVARFWIAVLVLAGAGLALGLAYGLELSTGTMEEISSLSMWAVLPAVIGGAAGALAQLHSERDSLVTTTATGFLVAVAFSPPAAVLGLSVALGRWDYVGDMAFVLTLTWVSVLASGAGILVLMGVRPERSAVGQGSPRHRTALLAGAGLLVATILAWQSTHEVRFRKGDRWRAAVAATHDAVAWIGDVRLLEAEARFTRRDIPLGGGDEALRVSALVERRTGDAADSTVERRVRTAVEERIRERLPGVRPFVDVVVVPP
jgi:hypothetical protein